MTKLLRSRADEGDRGAVLPIVALSLVVLMVMTAFSVDIGRQILRRRQAQAVADVMALDLTRQVDGRTRAQIEADPQWDQTRQDGAARNGFGASGVTAVLGHWDGNSQTFIPSAPTGIPDSVQVIANDVVDFYFARVIGADHGNVSRNAVGTQLPPCIPGNCPCPTPADCPQCPPGGCCPPNGCPPPCLPADCPDELTTTATGWLGSVAAGFQFYADGLGAQYDLAAQLRAKVLNSTLYTQFGISGAVGTAIPPTGLNLDALSYKGISNGSVRLGDLAAAAGFGSVDALLDATITARQLLDAEVTALRNSSNVADVAAGNKLLSFVGTASSSSTIKLRNLIRIGQGEGDRAANYRINALHLLTASGELINGKNFFSTTINTNIPGAPTVPIRVAIIQPPQIVTNSEGSGPCADSDYAPAKLKLPPGCGPRTSQVRVAADIPLTLNYTVLGIPFSQATTIPVVFEAAVAQGYYSSIRCAQPTSNSKTNYRVVTNGVAMSIGSVSDASLQSTTTMNVQSSALLHGSITVGFPPVSINLDASTMVSQSKTFKNGAIYSGQSASNSAVLGRDETHLFTGNLPTNILPTSWRYVGGLGNTNISNTMFNSLGITDPVLNASISSALNTQLANLDTYLMDPVLSALGVSIAGADGSISYVDCIIRLVK